jgi:hypothetical protein
MTENPSNIFAIFVISILGTILMIAVIVVILRWILRINVIVELLGKIAASHKCDSCNRFFRIDEIKRIDSGQKLCPECLKNFTASKPSK